MYIIGKRFKFSASHRLLNVPAGHKCGRHHGHNYEVDVMLHAADEQVEQPPYWVCDFGELGSVQKYIDRRLDHQDLNAVLVPHEIPDTTAELLARFLFRKLTSPVLEGGLEIDDVACVRVWETPTCWAEYWGPLRIGPPSVGGGVAPGRSA